MTANTVYDPMFRDRTYVSRPHNPTDLLHGVEIRAQTTVHGEDLLVDDSSNRQAIEAVRKCLP